MSWFLCLYILAATLNVYHNMATGKTDFRIGVILGEKLDLSSLSHNMGRVMDIYRRWMSVKDANITTIWKVLNSSSRFSATKVVSEMISEGAEAFVTVLTCRQRRVVSLVTEAFRIPHLCVDLDLCPSRDRLDFTLHLAPQYSSLAIVIDDIVEAVGCSNALLVLDDSLEFDLYRLVVQLSVTGIQSILVNVSLNRGGRRLSIPQHTVWIISSDNLQMFTHKNHDFLSGLDNHTWIYVTENQSVEDFAKLSPWKRHSDILLLQRKPISLCKSFGLPCCKEDETLMFLEGRLAGVLLMLHKALNEMRKRRTPRINETLSFSSLQQWGDTELMEVLSQMCDARNSNTCDSLSKPLAYELFVIPARHSQKVIPVAEWTEDNGLTVDKASPHVTNELFPNILTDFGGVTLKVVVHGDSSPYASRDNGDDTLHRGLTVDMLDDLSTVLNFRYTLVESPDNMYGNKLSNGSWTGMIGMVARREADMGIGTFTVTHERAEVVDFTTAYMQDSLGILTPKPRESSHLFQVFKPFCLWVWLTLTGFVLMGFIIILFINCISHSRTNQTSRSQANETSVQQNLLLILSSFFQQGPTFHPSSFSARCFLTFWFVFTLLTMAMYTAHLAAVLTVFTPTIPINSLQDIVDQTDLGIVVVPGTSTWEMFKVSKLPLYQQIGQRMTGYNTEASMEAVLEGRACYIEDRAILEYQKVEHCSTTRLADEYFRSSSIAFILPKKSPYRKAINTKIQKMVESGHIEGWQKKWLPEPINCTSGVAVAITLGLDRIGGLVILYGGLALLGVIILLTEMKIHRNQKTKKQSSETD